MKISLKGKFLLIFTTISIGSIIITAIHEYYFQRKFFIKKIEQIAINDLNLAEKEIVDLNKWIIRDLHLIKNLPDFKNFINFNNSEFKKKVLQDFIAIANTHKIYDQIRFLNEKGYEILRVNFKKGKGIIVPDRKLQFKAHRYYFQEAKKLKKGEIYISPLDLNIENNKIEIPFKPVIRYIIPVYDNLGKRKGFIILNVLGCEILKILNNRQNQNFGNYFLINKDGFFLFHPDFNKTFSFMFKNKKQYKFNIKKFENKKSGVIIEKNKFGVNFKIIVFKKIVLNNCVYWYMVHSIKFNSIFPEAKVYFHHILILICVMILFCFFPAIFFALKFIRPLNNLTIAAENIKNGNLNVKVPIESDDELGKFCKVFNKMIENLKESEKFKRKIREEIAIVEEKERRKIGEFIHEELAQDVAFLKFKLRDIQEKKCIGVDEDFKELENLTSKIIKQIRNTINELYPVVLYKNGLVEAIEWYIGNFENKTKIRVIMHKILKKRLKISRSKEIYIFRAFKEILNNIWKHADASEIIVTLIIDEKFFKLIIDDDGKGFDVKDLFSKKEIKGIGLFSIKEWVEDMDGYFDIESEKGHGTRIIIEVPNK